MSDAPYRPPRGEAEPESFSSFRVRPYLLTGGRTRSDVALPLEAMVHVTELGRVRTPHLGHELRDIAQLCHQPQSVAEISAHLRIHLQVARILVGDLIGEGLVAVHKATQRPTDRPDLRLLERVLDGLQSL
jgi:hypothetical protein